MNKNDFNNLPMITNVCDLPEKSEFYSWEHFHTKTVHQDWVTLYDDNFNALGMMRVKYLNALSGLQRIARSDDKDPVLLAYDRIRLNPDFDLIEESTDTLILLETFARNVA